MWGSRMEGDAGGPERDCRDAGCRGKNSGAGVEVEMGTGSTADRMEDVAMNVSAGPPVLVKGRGNPEKRSLSMILTHLFIFLCRI